MTIRLFRVLVIVLLASTSSFGGWKECLGRFGVLAGTKKKLDGNHLVVKVNGKNYGVEGFSGLILLATVTAGVMYFYPQGGSREIPAPHAIGVHSSPNVKVRNGLVTQAQAYGFLDKKGKLAQGATQFTERFGPDLKTWPDVLDLAPGIRGVAQGNPSNVVQEWVDDEWVHNATQIYRIEGDPQIEKLIVKVQGEGANRKYTIRLNDDDSWSGLEIRIPLEKWMEP